MTHDFLGNSFTLASVTIIRNQDYISAFGEHIRSLRVQKGFTMSKLADLANIEYGQLSRIERGIVNTTISTVYSISEALELPTEQLFQFKVHIKSSSKTSSPAKPSAS